MKAMLRIAITSLLVLASTTRTVEAGELMQVEVAFGTDYANALGQAGSAAAKERAELRLVQDLGEKIKYFDFVRTNPQAKHTLTFRIDHPSATPSNGAPANLHDYYVFLTLDGKGSTHDSWLFRDAASNLSGAESPDSIAQSLSKQAIDNRRLIIEAFLGTVSFTNEATFMSDIPGWRINRSRAALCIKEDSEIKVHSTVPGALFEDDFEALVKSAPGLDLDATLSKVKQQQDIDRLIARPDEARVLAVYVLKYEQECPPAQLPPSATSFATGGTP